MKVIVHVDGGARGNPGPAAAACVINSPQGDLLAEDVQLLGEATNNVAEYRALLLGLRRARELGASEIELVADSELVVKQVSGTYKVRHEAMRRLHGEAMTALRAFESWSIRAVARAQNTRADALVNAALDQAAGAPSSERGLEPPAFEPSQS
jgi:ribonuclease HI